MSYNYKRVGNNTYERKNIIYPYVYWNNAFSNDEITNIENYMRYDTDGVKPATVFNQNESVENTARKSQVYFFHKNEKTFWFFDKLNYYIDQLNNDYYNFDLNGYDNIQYTEYHSSVLGKYDWHLDTFITRELPNNEVDTRKLSVIIMMNDPNKDFAGGKFELNSGAEAEVPMEKGKLIMFPSFLLHRVTPVTQGIRKTLVTWVVGPKFK
jgi:PKHD-type hydroxylase